MLPNTGMTEASVNDHAEETPFVVTVVRGMFLGLKQSKHLASSDTP